MASSFPGEAFLETRVPDPDVEGFWLGIRLTLTLVSVVVFAPLVLGKLFPTKGDEVPVAVKWLPWLNITGLFVAGFWILRTSNNLFSARSVFVAPLLTENECQLVIQLGHDAAMRNIELFPNNTEFNMSPRGWRKKRHGSYPTTDLNLVTDPFTDEDRQFLSKLLHARLAPLIHRVYGMAPASIRANDMFLVRYDADEGQQSLEPHTDEAHVSFNVLLNDDFEGGGTRFHNRWSGKFFDVHPPKGRVLLSNAVIRHEGLQTTQGTRYILVGFLSIDRKRPSTGADTGLSLYSSWLSMPWAQVRLKWGHEAIARRLSGELRHHEKKWTDNVVMYQWFMGMANLFQYLGDRFSPHVAYTLVKYDKTNQYLAAMDRAPLSLFNRANWFSGQQLMTDVNGNVVEQWNSRNMETTDPKEL